MKVACIFVGMPKFDGIVFFKSQGCGRAPVAGQSQSTRTPGCIPSTTKCMHISIGKYFLECKEYIRILISFNCFSAYI